MVSDANSIERDLVAAYLKKYTGRWTYYEAKEYIESNDSIVVLRRYNLPDWFMVEDGEIAIAINDLPFEIEEDDVIDDVIDEYLNNDAVDEYLNKGVCTVIDVIRDIKAEIKAGLF